ncbi:MAG TPA: transmembrane 220 family protein [Pedobacter sp.]|jgi:Ca2+/H+ antiporter
MVRNSLLINTVNAVFIVLFVASAALQYNDPDPYLWMPIYLYPAVLCYFAINGKYYPKAYLIGIVLYLAYAIFLFFNTDGVLSWINQHNAENLAQSMKATKPYIESAREFFGLLILVLSLLFNLIYGKSRTRLS